MTKSNKPVERITLSVPETAEALGISIRWAWQLVKAGTIPSFRLGSRRMVYVDELKQFGDTFNGSKDVA